MILQFLFSLERRGMEIALSPETEMLLSANTKKAYPRSALKE